MQKRTIFIGDVHGCYDELIELIQKVDLRAEDHLYFAGDLINKWPKSREVVEFVRNRPNTWSVIGNHEYYVMMQKDEIPKERITRGIERWIFSEDSDARLATIRDHLTDHREWLLSLPTVIESEDWILIHGGIHPDYGVHTPLQIATTVRELDDGLPWYDHYFGEKTIIYGHWAVDGLRIRPNTIGLDSGCVFGGHLTAFCWETHEIWQVHAHDVYKIPADHRGKIIKMN